MKKFIIYLTGILIISGSCNDFLNVNPPSEVVNDDMFSQAEGYEDALYGVYASLAHSNLYGKTMIVIPELLTQNFITHNALLYYVSILNLQNNFARQEYKNIWKEAYLAISYLNNIIGHCEGGEFEKYPHKNLYKGEALGLRAFIHFDILRLFAVHINSTDETAKQKAIPYVKEYDFKVTPYSSVAEAYEYIINDLKEAERCLTEDRELIPAIRKKRGGVFEDTRELHFNLYAAQAMLARVYWMKGDMENAKTYALKVIESGKFQLEEKTAVKNMIKTVLSFKETIWGLYSKDFGDYMYTEQIKTNNMELPHNWKLVYENTQGPEPGKDYRLDGWFEFLDYAGNGKDVCIKLLAEQNAVIDPTAYSGINMIRLPEMYYIVAEAFIKENKPEDARRYLDAVIVSRGMIPFADRDSHSEVDFEDIMNERKKEYIGEGQEWYNMKRQNKAIYVYGWNKSFPGSDEIYTLIKPLRETDYRPD